MILEPNVPNAITIGIMFAGLVIVFLAAKKFVGMRKTPAVSNTPRASWPAAGGS